MEDNHLFYISIDLKGNTMTKIKKDFNLTKAQNGAEIRTRSGLLYHIVHVLKTDGKNKYPLMGYFIDQYGYQTPLSHSLDGKHSRRGDPDELDLIILEEAKQTWTNVYREKSTGKICVVDYYKSSQEAIDSAKKDSDFYIYIKARLLHEE